MMLQEVYARLRRDISTMTFGLPTSHVYRPLDYARKAHGEYLSRFGSSTKEIVFLGMNPGPFGMAQTGVPFGDVATVGEWLTISSAIGKPEREHPKRPVLGLDCPRVEVSGSRLWGWIRSRWETPDAFFSVGFVANYCPLLFLEEGGRNRTPDRLARHEKEALFAACDDALRGLVRTLRPRWVIGVGAFATTRAQAALDGADIGIGQILHPSPANPAANRGWATAVETQLNDLGVASWLFQRSLGVGNEDS